VQQTQDHYPEIGRGGPHQAHLAVRALNALAATTRIEPFLTLCNRSRFRSDHMLGLLAVGCW
jgi:hypothetical protein